MAEMSKDKQLQIKHLQKVDLEMLKLFISICKKHHLRYFAVGGTVLGAVRHKGFIPWDDDVDVGMPRPDYDQFLKVAPSELSNRYRIRTIDDIEDYQTYMVRMEDLSVEMYREYYAKRGTEMRKSYAWIDIFPLDGMPNDRSSFYRHINKIKHIRQLLTFSLLNKNMATSKKRGKRQMQVIQIGLKTGVYRLLSPKRLYQRYCNLCLKYPYDESQIVGNTMAVYGKKENGRKEYMPRYVFGEPTYMPFVDIQLACPNQVDYYLRHLYGDYMTLPPKEERITHEVYELNIDDSGNKE